MPLDRPFGGNQCDLELPERHRSGNQCDLKLPK